MNVASILCLYYTNHQQQRFKFLCSAVATLVWGFKCFRIRWYNGHNLVSSGQKQGNKSKYQFLKKYVKLRRLPKQLKMSSLFIENMTKLGCFIDNDIRSGRLGVGSWEVFSRGGQILDLLLAPISWFQYSAAVLRNTAALKAY